MKEPIKSRALRCISLVPAGRETGTFTKIEVFTELFVWLDRADVFPKQSTFVITLGAIGYRFTSRSRRRERSYCNVAKVVGPQ